MEMKSVDKLLEMKNISKSFSGVKVLHDVDFSLNKGEIIALCGENGAGKSGFQAGIYRSFP